MRAVYIIMSVPIYHMSLEVGVESANLQANRKQEPWALKNLPNSAVQWGAWSGTSIIIMYQILLTEAGIK